MSLFHAGRPRLPVDDRPGLEIASHQIVSNSSTSTRNLETFFQRYLSPQPFPFLSEKNIRVVSLLFWKHH